MYGKLWGEISCENFTKKPYRALKLVLFDTQKKIKSSHFLSLQCVAVSWINVPNRIEKVDETPFLYFVAQMVRMHQKLALFLKALFFLMDHRYTGG